MPCELHHGMINANGNENPVPAHIYVDDALVAAPGLDRIKKALVACIEAIFVVLGILTPACVSVHLQWTSGLGC